MSSRAYLSRQMTYTICVSAAKTSGDKKWKMILLYYIIARTSVFISHIICNIVHYNNIGGVYSYIKIYYININLFAICTRVQ